MSLDTVKRELTNKESHYIHLDRMYHYLEVGNVTKLKTIYANTLLGILKTHFTDKVTNIVYFRHKPIPLSQKNLILDVVMGAKKEILDITLDMIVDEMKSISDVKSEVNALLKAQAEGIHKEKEEKGKIKMHFNTLTKNMKYYLIVREYIQYINLCEKWIGSEEKYKRELMHALTKKRESVHNSLSSNLKDIFPDMERNPEYSTLPILPKLYVDYSTEVEDLALPKSMLENKLGELLKLLEDLSIVREYISIEIKEYVISLSEEYKKTFTKEITTRDLGEESRALVRSTAGKVINIYKSK